MNYSKNEPVLGGEPGNLMDIRSACNGLSSSWFFIISDKKIPN
jgi:hypothetical protein